MRVGVLACRREVLFERGRGAGRRSDGAAPDWVWPWWPHVRRHAAAFGSRTVRVAARGFVVELAADRHGPSSGESRRGSLSLRRSEGWSASARVRRGMARHSSGGADRSVPGFGGPNDRAGSRDGQAALRLHAVIAVIAFVLCAFVSAIFFWMGTPVLGVIFAVIALACLGVLGWAIRLRRRGAAARTSRPESP